MQPLSPEVQAQLESHLTAVAEILYAHTESDKLKDFESIEWEVRNQVLTQVAPRLGEFFSQGAELTAVANNDMSKVVWEQSPSANNRENDCI